MKKLLTLMIGGSIVIGYYWYRSRNKYKIKKFISRDRSNEYELFGTSFTTNDGTGALMQDGKFITQDIGGNYVR